MSQNWLPIRCDLHVDPAVIAIADATGTDEFSVVGRLVRLWSWANEQLPDGNAQGVTVAWIDRYLSCSGFASAMVKAGWLEQNEHGVAFPKFEVWNSQGAKIRKLTAERVKKHRAKGNAERNADGVTPVTQQPLPRERDRERCKESPTVSGADALPPAGVKSKPEPKPRKEPTGPHADARRAFCERWKAKYGEDYAFDFKKHGAMLQWMLTQVKDDVPKLIGVMERFLADADSFFVGQGHLLEKLRQSFNRWLFDPNAAKTTPTLSSNSTPYEPYENFIPKPGG